MNECVDYPLLETLLKWHNTLFFLMAHQQQKVSTLYWKCLATRTGFSFKILQWSRYERLEMSKSASFNFVVIVTISFHLRSAQDNVRKKVGVPNCFTSAKTWLKSFSISWSGYKIFDCFSKLHTFETTCIQYSSHLLHCNINLLLQTHILQNILKKEKSIYDSAAYFWLKCRGLWLKYLTGLNFTSLLKSTTKLTSRKKIWKSKLFTELII